MAFSPLPSSSINLSALCSFQRSTSSFALKVKDIPRGKLHSARVSKNIRISPTIKLHFPIFTFSNMRPNGHLHRVNSMQTQDEPDRSNTELERKPFHDVLWRFTKPYVLVAVAIGYICVVGRTWFENRHLIGWFQLLKALGGLVAVCSVYCYMAAINQIFDVEIDRINKPDSPIASGEMSLELAWQLTAVFSVIAFAIAGVLNNAPFAYSIYALYFLGTIYSVPPFSMKRSTMGALIVCALGAGLATTLISYSAALACLGRPFVLSWPVAFLSHFLTLHCSAAAIIKDLSDIEGDRKHKVPTLATAIGVRNTTFLSTGIITLNYIGAIVAAIFMPQTFQWSVSIPAHTILSLCLIYKAWKLDKENYKKEESFEFYQYVFKLMSLENILFLFI